MKRIALTLIFVLILPQATAQAAVKVGGACKSIGATTKVRTAKLICTKVGKKNVWSMSAQVKPIPTFTTQPTVDYSQIQIDWVLSPLNLSKPGTVLDPDPTSLQDNGRNSSFVARVLNGKEPISGLSVSWSADDASANLESPMAKTDKSGLVRAWYISGKNPIQEVTLLQPDSGKKISISLGNLPSSTPTLGRPVVLGVKAPLNSGRFESVEIEGKINSTPLNTYYAFANFSNFYTGIQMVDCKEWNLFDRVCSPERTEFRGHEAHFSVWDGKGASGEVLQPIVVEAPSTTKCTPFDHEGSGRMCFAVLDWKIETSIRFQIERISGAKNGYERLRVLVSTLGIERQILAVIDVPGGVNLNSEFAAFNENWKLNQSAGCHDVPLRSFAISRVDFLTSNGLRVKPTEGYFYGNEVHPGQTLCANWGVSETAQGIELSSGGTTRWVEVSPSLKWRSIDKFVDAHQSVIMLRDIKFKHLGG